MYICNRFLNFKTYKNMAFIIKDTNPQYSGMGYLVGTRKIRDPQGRDCEAADFGAKSNAKKFNDKRHATEFASVLNKMAGHTQFVVEEESIYGQQYGRHRASNGFNGFGHLPEPQDREPQHGGFSFVGSMSEDNGGGGYNGF